MDPAIVEEVESHIARSFVVHSSGFGEPFVSRHAMPFFKTIKKHHPYLDVITNGTLLEGKEDELIESGLDTLIVSMDGGTKEVFEHFRAGAKWDQVTRSLKKLHERKLELKAIKPQLHIEFVAMAGNLHTFPELVKRAAIEWGASGIAAEPLLKGNEKGYLDFYMEQNLSNIPFEKVEALFVEAYEAGTSHGLTFNGPHFDGDRRALWENAQVKAIFNIEFPRPGLAVDGTRDFYGWALHPGGVDGVTFHLGDQEERPARNGEDRQDVAGNMPQDFSGKEKSGFFMPLDLGVYDDGTHALRIMQLSKGEEVAEMLSMPVTLARGAFHQDKVASKAQGVIEHPGEGHPISGNQFL